MTTIMSRSAAKCWWGIDLPKGVLSVRRDHPGAEWVAYTKKQLNAKKTENQNVALRWKRAVSATKPCYVWVFYNNSDFFGGWHIYIKTLHKDFPLNFRIRKVELIMKCMSLFPCGILPIPNLSEKWMSTFAIKYKHIGFKRGKGKWRQGLTQCWCTIDEGNKLIDIYNKRDGKL